MINDQQLMSIAMDEEIEFLNLFSFPFVDKRRLSLYLCTKSNRTYIHIE